MLNAFRSRRRARPVTVAAICVGIVGTGAAFAMASTADAAGTGATPAGEGAASELVVVGEGVRFTAADNQANLLSIVWGKDAGYWTYSISDVYDIDIEADTGCVYPDESDHTAVVCTLEQDDYGSESPISLSTFVLRDQSDTVNYVNETDQGYYDIEFWLGSGNDRIVTRQDDGVVDGSQIWGQNGRDTIIAGKIYDIGSIHGGNNNDVIRVTGANWVSGGNGDDKIYGSDGAQWLRGDQGDDLITGGDGKDRIWGGAGDDTLHGGHGADSIWGNSGDDVLHGGLGIDQLSGGPGKDVVKKR